MLPGDALGLWVKGDGSGALLNVQIRSPREYQDCISDHYIDLDFAGWRCVEILLRELAIRSGLRITCGPMAAEEAAPSTETRWTGRSVSEINLLLNEIPAKGKVDILLRPIPLADRPAGRVGEPVAGSRRNQGDFSSHGAVRAVHRAGGHGRLRSVRRTGRTDQPLPAASGEAAAAGRGHQRDPVRLPAAARPERQRAEITVVSLGQPFGGRRPDAEIDWKRLDREYDIPRIVTRPRWR